MSSTRMGDVISTDCDVTGKEGGEVTVSFTLETDAADTKVWCHARKGLSFARSDGE